MTKDQLWGAVFLALGVFQACWLYRELDSGNWSFVIRGVWLPSVDRRSHPIIFWIGVTWDVLAMIALIGVGAYGLAPLIFYALGK